MSETGKKFIFIDNKVINRDLIRDIQFLVSWASNNEDDDDFYCVIKMIDNTEHKLHYLFSGNADDILGDCYGILCKENNCEEITENGDIVGNCGECSFWKSILPNLQTMRNGKVCKDLINDFVKKEIKKIINCINMGEDYVKSDYEIRYDIKNEKLYMDKN